MDPASRQRNRRNHKLALKRRSSVSQIRGRKRGMRRRRIRGN